MSDNQDTRAVSRRDQLYNAVAVAMSVLLPLSLTFVLWERERDRVEVDARTEFEFRVRETTDAVRARMLAYEHVLRGAAALFTVSDTVTRDEWRDYVRLLEVSKSHPGIVAITYAPIVTAQQASAFIAGVRGSGHASFRVWPEGARPVYAPVLYVEPWSERSMRALGFDLYSDPVQAAALANARDTGQATLSALIAPLADAADTPAPSASMYVPVFQRGTVPATRDERRATLTGFVSGGIRMNDLIGDLLANRYKLELNITEQSSGITGPPLVLPDRQAAPSARPAKFATAIPLELHHRLWTLSYRSTPEFERSIDNERPRLVLISGLLLSGALIALIWSLASTRHHALKLAADMTAELRTKQEALSESEERLGLALQGSDLALFDWDVSTGMVRLSERWEAMLGDTPHETTTTIAELLRLVHPDDLALVEQEQTAVLSGDSETYRVEHRVSNRRGDWLWILSRAKATQRDAEGRPSRITGTHSDVTARKQVEQMKNEFVGTVSHELRTPLTVVVGSLSLLKQELADLNAEQSMMLAMACDNSARLQSLVNDILDFEKIASGAARFDLRPVPLVPFLHRGLELNRGYADRLNVRYELAEPLPPVTMLVDPDRLMQVLTNLMSNAAKFSPAHSVVTLAARVSGGRVRISVTDRGPGVPPEFQSRIFEKFAQADASDARQKGGTGLGLSISKSIIEKLGGSLGFESRPGEETTFYFEVPLQAPVV